MHVIVEHAEHDCTSTLYLHDLQHCWSLQRLYPRLGDEGQATLRVGKQFARLTSALPDQSARDSVTHGIYLKPHKKSQKPRPKIRRVAFVEDQLVE